MEYVEDLVKPKRKYKKSTIIHGVVEKVEDKASHYVSRGDFFTALVNRREALKTNPDLPVSEFIGECIVKICKGMASKWNFAGYTWKDEMVSDAILHALRYIDSFNPEISTNPFSYVSQMAFNVFINRIEIEKEEQYVKYASTLRSAASNEFFSQPDKFTDYEIDLSELNMEDMNTFVNEFERKRHEAKLRAKRPKRKADRPNLDEME
jgi:hypothetical protein